MFLLLFNTAFFPVIKIGLSHDLKQIKSSELTSTCEYSEGVCDHAQKSYQLHTKKTHKNMRINKQTIVSMKGLHMYMDFDLVLSNWYSYPGTNKSTPSWTRSYYSELWDLADWNAIQLH